MRIGFEHFARGSWDIYDQVSVDILGRYVMGTDTLYLLHHHMRLHILYTSGANHIYFLHKIDLSIFMDELSRVLLPKHSIPDLGAEATSLSGVLGIRVFTELCAQGANCFLSYSNSYEFE